MRCHVGKPPRACRCVARRARVDSGQQHQRHTPHQHRGQGPRTADPTARTGERRQDQDHAVGGLQQHSVRQYADQSHRYGGHSRLQGAANGFRTGKGAGRLRRAAARRHESLGSAAGGDTPIRDGNALHDGRVAGRREDDALVRHRTGSDHAQYEGAGRYCDGRQEQPTSRSRPSNGRSDSSNG